MFTHQPPNMHMNIGGNIKTVYLPLIRLVKTQSFRLLQKFTRHSTAFSFGSLCRGVKCTTSLLLGRTSRLRVSSSSRKLFTRLQLELDHSACSPDFNWPSCRDLRWHFTAICEVCICCCAACGPGQLLSADLFILGKATPIFSTVFFPVLTHCTQMCLMDRSGR